MPEEPKPLREIHQIQKNLFAKEKNLTARQRIAKLRKEAAAIKKKYGLNLKTAAK